MLNWRTDFRVRATQNTSEQDAKVNIAIHKPLASFYRARALTCTFILSNKICKRDKIIYHGLDRCLPVPICTL